MARGPIRHGTNSSRAKLSRTRMGRTGMGSYHAGPGCLFGHLYPPSPALAATAIRNACGSLDPPLPPTTHPPTPPRFHSVRPPYLTEEQLDYGSLGDDNPNLVRHLALLPDVAEPPVVPPLDPVGCPSQLAGNDMGRSLPD